MHKAILDLCFISLFVYVVEPVELIIDNVKLHGNEYKIDGSGGHEFFGIPYAEPPIGELRFAKPKPLINKWPRTKLTTPMKRCMQPPILQYSNFHRQLRKYSNVTIPGYDEDCLYLNIWKPANTTATALKAVMVWIHGGLFYFGESYPHYNGRSLAALGDVVVVTLNYRLGVFGFLRLDNSIGGNWGLWDQQLALKWIKENIEHFHGNPSSVTLFGQSAGAVCVSLHLLNPDSAKLFKRAIVQSGAPTAHWAFHPNVKLITKIHRRFASSLGCKKENAKGILKCLRNVDKQVIVMKGISYVDYFGFVLFFAPVVDGEFLKKPPTDILASGQNENKEIMLGVVQNEGGGLTSRLLRQMKKNKYLKHLMKVFDPRVPPALYYVIKFLFRYYPHYPSKLHHLAIDILKAKITAHDNPDDKVVNEIRLSRAVSYGYFVCPANRMADFYARVNSSVYFYEFIHRPSSSEHESHVGVTHHDEISFVFGMNFIHPKIFPYKPSEIELSKRIMHEWSTFARTGRPNSTAWKPFTLEKMEYFKLNIDSDQEAAKIFGINRTQCTFWNDIIPLLNEHVAPCSQFTILATILSVILFMHAISMLFNYCRRKRNETVKNDEKQCDAVNIDILYEEKLQK